MHVGALTISGCLVFAAIARWLNPDIGYANGFGCDDWYFFGLQLNFREIYNWKLYYQVFRFPALVPWIFLANRINYETLNALKFFTYLVLTSVGFFWFSARLFGTRVAAVVTVLFCCSTAFLGVLSNDYVTAAGVAWISLFLGATSEAAYSQRPAWWGIAAGCFFGLAFYTHIPIVFFVFSVPLIYFAGPNTDKGPISFARYATGGFAGFVLMSAVCGLYNVSLGGDWFFLGPEFRYAFLLARDTAVSRAYRTVGFMWLVRETTVFAMLIGVLASLAVLCLNLLQSNVRNTNLAAIAYLLIAGVTIGWEFSGRIILQTNVYAPWVFPTLFMAIGAALWQLKVLREMPWRHLAVVLFVMAVVLLIAARTYASPTQDTGTIAFKIALGGIFVLSSVILRSSKAGLLAPACLTLFAAVNYPSGYGGLPWSRGHVPLGRDMAIQAAQAVHILQEVRLTGNPAFWLDLGQPERIAIPRSYLYCGNFGASFPSLTPREGLESLFSPVTRKSFGEKRNLVVVASGEHIGELAARRLRALGFDSTTVGEWPIGSGTLKSTVAVLRLDPSLVVHSSSASVTFVGPDTTTQGNWSSHYGRAGHAILSEPSGETTLSQLTFVGGTPYIWASATSDSRALRFTESGRIAAAVFGERFQIDIDFNDDAEHQVALYGVDWDTTERDERIDVLAASTGALLDTRRLDAFNRGKYLVWNVRGDVSFVVTRVGGANAVLSGVFLDPPAREQSVMSVAKDPVSPAAK